MAFGVGNYRPSGGTIKDVLIENNAATDIKQGDIVMVLASGYGYSGAVDDADPETTGAVVFGVALEDANYANGDRKVRCDIGGAQVKVTMTGGSQAQTDLGVVMFVDGAQTVDATGGVSDQIKAGPIVEIVSATVVWVKLLPYGTLS